MMFRWVALILALWVSGSGARAAEPPPAPLAPTAVEAPAALPVLTPIGPQEAGRTPAGLDYARALPIFPWTDPPAAVQFQIPLPAAPPPASASAIAPDPRLHAGLDWAFCGPRPGADSPGPPPLARDSERLPVALDAGELHYDRPADLLRAWGGVEIRQGAQRLQAERAAFARNEDRIQAAGQVLLESPGLRIAGTAAEYRPEARQGVVDNAQYRVWGNANLRGTAARAWLDSETLSRYRDIRYTTCPPGRTDWSLQARDLTLDQASGMGTAWHTRIQLGPVPVFYSPYLHFPIDGKRHSGFLSPSFGSSDDRGLDITLPYYWNIAPQMDLTFVPRYMSTRGLMLGAEFRHLTRFQTLDINVEALPEDRQAPEEGMRGALRIEQRGWLGERWSSQVDLATVSDARYLQDFGNRLDVTSLRNLSQRGDLRYRADQWTLSGRIQQFQTVDTDLAPADRPYAQLPHIEFALDPRQLAGTGRWLEYSLTSQYDYFDHRQRIHGSRLVAVPTVRLPLRRSFGALIPRARVFYTGYDLTGADTDDTDTDTDSAPPMRQSYVIPSLDLDGRLIFERAADWFGTAALQTLEPRLYYVFTGFEDQSDAPRFDTTALDFSFASLFRANRFTGFDRIGDENRLTFGVTSRTLAQRTGREILRASLGQVYYFDDRRVQLDDSAPEETPRSALAGELAARLHPDWSVRASVQWNPERTEDAWEKRVLQLRYAPDDDRLVNLAYRYNLGASPDTRYENSDLSFRLPLGSRIQFVGRWLYSWLNEDTVEAFAGIEFGRCCWRLRLLGQHLKTDGEREGHTGIMLQLELAGLGAFGNRIDKLLEQDIYGYHAD